ncbi:MAG: J domain-containing protein [Candidatus Nanopelagicales bacterium]
MDPCSGNGIDHILGNPRNSRATDDQQEIKRAYRKKALLHHSDRGGRHEDMVRVNLAYEVLSDPENRRRYRSFIQQRAAEQRRRANSGAQGTDRKSDAQQPAGSSAQRNQAGAPQANRCSPPPAGPTPWKAFWIRVEGVVVGLVVATVALFPGFFFSFLIFVFVGVFVPWISPGETMTPCVLGALFYAAWAFVGTYAEATQSLRDDEPSD